MRLTVVGVVRDSSQMSYEVAAAGEMYRPYQQYIFGVFMSTLVVRTSGDPLAGAANLRKAVWDIEPNQPILDVRGVYGVVAYTTALRAPEVGIRVALGATPGNVVGTLLGAALVPLATWRPAWRSAVSGRDGRRTCKQLKRN